MADTRALLYFFVISAQRAAGVVLTDALGSSTWNVVPSGSVDCTSMVPPWAWTIWLTMYSPMPSPWLVPPGPAGALEPRTGRFIIELPEKGSKSFERIARGIVPWLCTEI